MFDKKEWTKQWLKDNPEYMKEYHKKWNKDNFKHVKECKKKWNKDNSEHIKKQRRQRYLENREKILKVCKKYRENHYEEKKQHYKEKLQYIQDYKISKGCASCGYNKNPRFLNFHHPDNNKKEFDVWKAIHQNKNLEKIKKEMDKCILLCNSCHRKLHWKLKELDKIKKKV